MEPLGVFLRQGRDAAAAGRARLLRKVIHHRVISASCPPIVAEYDVEGTFLQACEFRAETGNVNRRGCSRESRQAFEDIVGRLSQKSAALIYGVTRRVAVDYAARLTSLSLVGLEAHPATRVWLGM
jgi:hypothetical protein